MSAAPTGKTLQKHRLSPNDWLRVYLLALLPLLLILTMANYDLVASLTRILIVFGIGLVAASLHPALGAILPLAIVLFSFLDPISGMGVASQWTRSSFWAGLILPFMLLALPLQWQAEVQHKNWQRWLRAALIGGAIGLGCLAALLMYGQLPGIYLWSALAIVPALLWITGAGDENPFDTGEGVAGMLLGVVFWGLASWQWYGVLFSTDLAAWLHYLLRSLFTLAGLVVLFLITFAVSIKDDEIRFWGSQEKPEIGLRRYFFFGSFLILGLLFENIIHALLATVLATALLSLMYPVLGKFEPGTRPARYPAAALSAFPALFMAVLLFYESGWLYTVSEFFIFNFPILEGFHYLWTLLIVALLVTISGPHWVSYIVAALLWLAIIASHGFSNVDVLLYAALWVVIGALIGMRRVLLWPLASAYLARLARRLQQKQAPDKIQQLRQQAMAILDWRVRPDPLGEQAILADFVRAGVVPQFESAALQERYRRAQEAAAAARLLAAQNLKDALEQVRGTALQERTEGLRKALQVRGQFAQFRSLAEAIYDLNEKQALEIEQRQHLLMLAHQYLHPLQESYWQIYRQIPKVDAEPAPGFDPALASMEQPSQDLLHAASEQAISAIEHQLDFLEALRPLRSRLPAKEQTCFRVLLETAQEMSRLRREQRLQRRTEIIQEAMVRLTDARAEQEEAWLVIAPGESEVIEQHNPWLLHLNAVYLQLENLRAQNEYYYAWASQAIADNLNGIAAVADLARLNDDLAVVTDFAVGYGGVLDQVLELLGQAGREAAAALAFPRGFSRNLGLQDTLDGINKLRSILGTRYQQETEALQAPLNRLAEMLLNEIHHVEAQPEGSGFRNPYLTGNPIRLNRAALFKGRRQLAQNIVSMLRGGGRPTIILYGARRTGKTSFLLQLPRLLPGNFLPVFLDMQEGSAQQNDGSFMYAIARAIYRQLKVDGDLARPNLSDFETHPYTTLTPWLEDEALPLLKSRILFITIDEFELIGSAIKRGVLSNQVLAYLRHLMQHNENIVLLFAGVQTLDALGPNPASYFISANPIEMSYLDPRDAEELIRSPDPSVGAMPPYDDDVVAEILRLTHCQPYLVQALCSEIINTANANNLQQIKMEVLADAIPAVLTSSLYFQNIWDDARPEGQALLRTLAGGAQPLAGGAQPLSGGAQPLQASEQLIADLLHRRVIRRNPDNSYTIEIPLVQTWIEQSH